MSDLSLFGLLILERDPLVLGDLPGLLQAWFQDAGGFAMLGLVVYLLYALRTPSEQAESARARSGVSGFMLMMAVLALFTYAVYGFLLFTGRGPDELNVRQYASDPGQFIKYVPPKFSTAPQALALMIGGIFALLGIGQPFAASLSKIRFGRIWALSKLGFKEAVRSRLFWMFLVFLFPFLFPANWFFPIKPEDELRSTVAVTSLSMNVLLLLPAALLAAFSIPNDIKNQNIYTIVTKPVERIEIIFGRFVGYTLLLTLALVAMTLGSLLFISYSANVGQSLDEAAKDETYKARVPLRGNLSFQSRKGSTEGVNVGREFDYRRYIAGDPSSSQRAVWDFKRIPSSLTSTDRDYVLCEFTFDIYRMTKGEENRGVDLIIRIATWQSPQKPPIEPKDGSWKWVDAQREQEYLREATELLRAIPNVSEQQANNPTPLLANAQPGTPVWGVANKLAEKYGFYETAGKEIFDYHPDSIPVPAGLFRNAVAGDPKNPETPRVSIIVKCNTSGQLLGMAEPDLYLLQSEQPFELNYLKSAFGLWCRLTLLIAVAVTLSSYLTGVIAFLMTMFLFIAGYASDHLMDMASGRSFVGGPFKAVNQLLRAEQPTAQSDPNSPLLGAITVFDQAFAWGVRRFINLVPDVYGYTWTNYVSEGFNIPFEAMVMNFLVLLGYIIPWFILGYFLIRSREVAA